MNKTTDEVATGGKWYNGKPIYRKMITGIHTGSAIDTWYSFFDLNSINAEDVIKIEGFIFWGTYNWWIPVNSGSGSAANTYIPIWKAGTNLQVLVSRTELLNNSNFWVIIEYTKH